MAENQNTIPPFEEGYQVGGLNRASQTRRDTDTVKTPKVTLYDIDYAMIYQLGEKLKLRVYENDVAIDVPVIYADGEKWTQIKSRGFLRDNKNVIVAPIIALRRTGFDPDSRLPILDVNNYVPRRRIYPYKTMNYQYDRLTNQELRVPSYEFYVVDLPNYIRVSYDVIIWTSLIEQMNMINQAIFATSGHLWGDYHTFRTVINSATMNNLNNVGEDRLVSTTMTLQVDGYLLEEFEYHEPTIEKAYTIKKVRFENEQEVRDFYLEEPQYYDPLSHISQEPKHIQLMNKRRNIRYR